MHAEIAEMQRIKEMRKKMVVKANPIRCTTR